MSPRRKYKMIEFMIAYELRVSHPVVVICIAIVTRGAHKLLVEDRNEIVIDVHVLVHPA